MVPHQVDRDAQDPGLDPAFAAEAGALLVGAQEAFLGESVGGVGIPHQQVDHPVHAPLVLAHDVVEPLRRDLFGGLQSRAKSRLSSGPCPHALSLDFDPMDISCEDVWTNAREHG